MKKYFIFAAAAVTFVACTEDVLIDSTKAPENNNEVAIGFGSDINKLVMTRADEDHAENSTGARGEGLENYHYTFRIWGYKNIKKAPESGSTTDTYISTTVFDGTSTSDKYANSIATWSPVANNTEPFYTATDKVGDWVYSPVRYWDKTATNYDFHAAAPDKDSTKTTYPAIDWKWNQINIGSDNNPIAITDATVDAKGAGYFTLGAADVPFKLNGESLPLANATSKTDASSRNNVTTQPNDVFGGKKGTLPTSKTEWEVKDVDLMIAEDVLETPTNHSSATNGNDRVNFHFNHILSRLNIGVKIGDQIAVKQMVKYNASDTKEYLLYTYNGDNYIKNEEKAQPVTLADDGTISNDGDPIDWPTTGIKIDDNVKNPTEGVVLLKSIEVVKLVTNGYFDEGVLAYKDDATMAMNSNDGTAGKPKVKPSELVNGTNLRWASATTPETTAEITTGVTNNYAFPNEKVTGLEDGDESSTEISGPLNLSKKFTVGAAPNAVDYTKDDYKMVFQGLVIPQVAEYESIAVDGSDKSSATTPYIKIVYSLDGETFTNYYNLAEVFSNVLGAYTITQKDETTGVTTTYTAYFTNANDTYVYKKGAENVYVDKDFNEKTVSQTVYFDGTNYYEKDSSSEKYKQLTVNPSSTDVILKCTATLDESVTGDYKYTIKVLAPVTRKEADLDGVAETECDITFCEGWQNNLWITINPTAILFDADVYKWATWTPEYDYPVE